MTDSGAILVHEGRCDEPVQDEVERFGFKRKEKVKGKNEY